jgi:hypothetical protein
LVVSSCSACCGLLVVSLESVCRSFGFGGSFRESAISVKPVRNGSVGYVGFALVCSPVRSFAHGGLFGLGMRLPVGLSFCRLSWFVGSSVSGSSSVGSPVGRSRSRFTGLMVHLSVRSAVGLSGRGSGSVVGGSNCPGLGSVTYSQAGQ